MESNHLRYRRCRGVAPLARCLPNEDFAYVTSEAEERLAHRVWRASLLAESLNDVVHSLEASNRIVELDPLLLRYVDHVGSEFGSVVRDSTVLQFQNWHRNTS